VKAGGRYLLIDAMLETFGGLPLVWEYGFGKIELVGRK
jgi:hypothetical protein